ncbi:MAG: putative small lipoprotein YifL [Phenylobacterium sp.]|jgi:predicted small lipoprotein YifL
MRKTLTLVSVFLTFCGLTMMVSGCGQKGQLVHPEQPPQNKSANNTTDGN